MNAVSTTAKEVCWYYHNHLVIIPIAIEIGLSINPQPRMCSIHEKCILHLLRLLGPLRITGALANGVYYFFSARSLRAQLHNEVHETDSIEAVSPWAMMLLRHRQFDIHLSQNLSNALWSIFRSCLAV